MHGPGTAGDGDVKRLLDDGPEVLAVLDQEVVLGRRAGDPDVVRLLERVIADQVGRHLPGERDDGDRVHESVLERRDEIRGGGSGGDEADADLARRARVAFGGMAGRGLLPHENVANALKVVEDVVDRQHRPAGQAEDEVDAFLLQALQQNPRPRIFHHFTSSSVRACSRSPRLRCRFLLPAADRGSLLDLCLRRRQPRDREP